jgi:hypothetical protein
MAVKFQTCPEEVSRSRFRMSTGDRWSRISSSARRYSSSPPQLAQHPQVKVADRHRKNAHLGRAFLLARRVLNLEWLPVAKWELQCPCATPDERIATVLGHAFCVPRAATAAVPLSRSVKILIHNDFQVLNFFPDNVMVLDNPFDAIPEKIGRSAKGPRFSSTLST